MPLRGHRTGRRPREQAGAIIVLPQFPRHDQGWNTVWHPLVYRLIEQVKEDHAVNEDKVYLVGMSLGGQGCWHLGADRPQMFAALVPICGNGEAESIAPRLKGVPVWAFHGAEDRVISVQGTRHLVSAIREAGGESIRYSEYPGAGHNCWDRALSEAELLDWLFRQSRESAAGSH